MTEKSSSLLNSRLHLEFPSGTVPLDSPFYISRPTIEALANFEISRPGALVKLEASPKMGKSSLLLRVMAQALHKGYQTIYLDLQNLESEITTSCETLLYWIFTNLSHQLGIPCKLDEYWDKKAGVFFSTTLYLKEYLLKKIKRPLLIAFIRVDRLLYFNSLVAQSFGKLLDYWYEESRKNSDLSNLKIITTFCTSANVNYNLSNPLIQKGIPLKLLEFNREQVIELAEAHEFGWQKSYQIKQLMDMVGGHPYFLRLAFYYLKSEEIGIKKLLEEAPTLSGIYSDYLRNLLKKVLPHPQLINQIKRMIVTNGTVQLEADIAHKLDGLGLVKLSGNNAQFSCELYRQYFSLQLLFVPQF